jgi:hypothetical protein
MSRLATITLATAATVAVASLASSTSYARGFVGGHAFGRGPAMSAHVAAPRVAHAAFRLHPIVPIRPIHPIVPIHFHPVWHHPHMHWVFRGGAWVEIDDVAVDTPVDVAPAMTPAPCTCLTKTYTPDGLVVFADICTKESASAQATGDAADASQGPTSQVPATATPIAQVPTTPNYAGRTYQDYLAANPQAAQPQASTQPPAPTPQPAPQQN